MFLGRLSPPLESDRFHFFTTLSLSAASYTNEAAALEKEHVQGKDVREERNEGVTKRHATEDE